LTKTERKRLEHDEKEWNMIKRLEHDKRNKKGLEHDESLERSI